MNKIILFLGIFFILSVNTVFSQQAEWDQAAQAYSNQDYEKAANIYLALLETGVSAELYYNYANSLYKQGDYANAILNYERALQIKPSYEDARFNLNFANSLITDHIEPMEVFFLTQWLQSLGKCFSVNTWAYMSVIFFVLFLSFLLFYLFSKIRYIRKISFFVTLALLLCFATSFVYTFVSKYDVESRSFAIIMSGSVSVKSAPDNSGTELFVLHEGTKVEILSSLGVWYEVKIADGNIGWMPSENLENI